MVRHRTGIRRRAFSDIETVHRRLRSGDAAAIRKIAGVAKVAGTVAKKIGIEGDNYLSAIKVVDRVYRLAESQLRRFARGVAPTRLPLVPGRAGKFREDCANLVRQRGRGHRLRQDVKIRATPGGPIG